MTPRFTGMLFSLLLSIFLVPATAYAQKAPDFSLKGDKGKTISLKNYRGKVVYVDFWASWCVPCRKSFPWMNEMQATYQNKGFEVIGVNLDSSHKEASRFLKQIPANFTIAYDPDGETPGKYQVSVMPTSFLVDKKGEIIYVHKGFKKSQSEDMEARIKEALAK